MCQNSVVQYSLSQFKWLTLSFRVEIVKWDWFFRETDNLDRKIPGRVLFLPLKMTFCHQSESLHRNIFAENWKFTEAVVLKLIYTWYYPKIYLLAKYGKQLKKLIKSFVFQLPDLIYQKPGDPVKIFKTLYQIAQKQELFCQITKLCRLF